MKMDHDPSLFTGHASSAAPIPVEFNLPKSPCYSQKTTLVHNVAAKVLIPFAKENRATPDVITVPHPSPCKNVKQPNIINMLKLFIKSKFPSSLSASHSPSISSKVKIPAFISNGGISYAESHRLISTHFNQIHRQAMDLTKILSKIGDYELDTDYKIDITSGSKIVPKKIKLDKASEKELYKGVKEGNSHRTKFINYLKEKVVDAKFESVSSKDPVKIKDLLGPKGLVLYKKAIKEENNSKKFREAVFHEATEYHEGAKWDKQLVLWIGGPSASGKSFSIPSVIGAVGKQMTVHQSNNEGNFVVSVDGGIERELSQIRQLVLQAAQNKGYPGIKDLHKHTRLNVKRYVKNAAIAGKHNLAIPDTFSNPGTIKQLLKFAKDDQFKQVFSEVVGSNKENFKKSVYRMGNLRAWKSSEKPLEKITVNNRKIEGESKEYQAKFFKVGLMGSRLARNVYKELSKAEGLYVKITHDLTYVKLTDKGMETADGTDTGPVVQLTQRQKTKLEAEIKTCGSFKQFVAKVKNVHKNDPNSADFPTNNDENCIKTWLKTDPMAKAGLSDKKDLTFSTK